MSAARILTTVAGLLLATLAAAGEDATQLSPRYVRPKPVQTFMTENVYSHAVVVKIVQPARVRLRNGALVSLDQRHDMVSLNDYLAWYPGLKIERVFTRPEELLEAEKAQGESRSGKELGDLNLYFLIDLRDAQGVDPETFVDELNSFDEVELAYPLPRSEPATVLAQKDQEVPAPVPAGGLGDYEPEQGHLNPAPQGLDAEWAWTLPGGRGANVRVIDIEHEFNPGHIDLPTPFTLIPAGYTTPAPTCDTTAPPPTNVCVYSSNHGTAVAGIVVATNNGWGTTGIASDAQYGFSDDTSGTSWPNVSNAINLAAAALSSGDVILYEMHAAGPASGLTCPCNCSQWEFIPMEYWQANYDATAAAVALGIHVVEAAGNGGMNLDHARYGGLFNRATRDSGAILIGAGSSFTHNPSCFTNFGSRVDLHAWGNGITTTGYGGRWAAFPQVCPPLSNCTTNHDSMYDNSFGGTSGASALITGATAVVQGVTETNYGLTLTPAQMRSQLALGATPQGTPTATNIGPMPDLNQAIRADLIRYVHSGWTDSVLARSATGCSASFCDVTTTLPGNSSGTYLNFAGRNNGIYETAGIETRVYIDDVWVWWASWGPLNPYTLPTLMNNGPIEVRGGRHTMRVTWDVNDSTPELSETNNTDTVQYIWSPRILTANVPIIRAAPPDRDTVGYSFYNCDGFQVTGLGGGNSWWVGSAVLPLSATDDYDIRLHDEEPTSTIGYGPNVAYSAWGAGSSDFVLQNGNNIGSTTTQWPGVLQGSGTPATGSMVVEFSVGSSFNPAQGTHGTFTLGGGAIVDVHEIYFDGSEAGSTFDIVIDNQGGADLGVTLYDASSFRVSKSQFMPGGFSDLSGAGGDETMTVTIPSSGWYGLAVWKVSSADRLLSSPYDINVGLTLPDLVPHAPPGWSSPVVLRSTVGCSSADCTDTATLQGNSTFSYFNHTGINAGPNPASGTYRTQYYVDDLPWAWWQSSSTVPAGGTFRNINYQLLSPIRGGRHTVGIDVDVLDGVAETNESNNTYFKQYVFSPYALTANLPVTRDAPPDRDTTGAVFFNSDGFSYTTGWWGAAAVMATSASDDYDVQLHDDYMGSTTGFASSLVSSLEGAGRSDFVMVNGNIVGWGSTFYAGVIQGFDTPAAGSFSIHHVTQTATVSPPGTYGTYNIPVGGVIFILELNVGLGSSFIFDLVNESGGANLGFGLFDGSGLYFRKIDAIASADNTGAGGNERFISLILTGGFDALVVWKNGPSDLAISSDFSITLREVLPTAVPDGSGGTEMLRVSRPGPSSLTVTWGAECNSQLLGTDYSLYIGDLDQLRSLGVWDYSADLPVCSAGTDQTETIATPAGNRFFLVVPHNGAQEGSYGVSSSNAERPAAGIGACYPQNLSGDCL